MERRAVSGNGKGRKDSQLIENWLQSYWQEDFSWPFTITLRVWRKERVRANALALWRGRKCSKEKQMCRMARGGAYTLTDETWWERRAQDCFLLRENETEEFKALSRQVSWVECRGSNLSSWGLIFLSLPRAIHSPSPLPPPEFGTSILIC